MFQDTLEEVSKGNLTVKTRTELQDCLTNIMLAGDYISSIVFYDNIGNYSNKVLIIHGTSDTTVPIEYSRKASEKYSNCILKEIVGAKHGFNADNYSFLNNYDNYVFDSIEQNITF